MQLIKVTYKSIAFGTQKKWKGKWIKNEREWMKERKKEFIYCVFQLNFLEQIDIIDIVI